MLHNFYNKYKLTYASRMQFETGQDIESKEFESAFQLWDYLGTRIDIEDLHVVYVCFWEHEQAMERPEILITRDPKSVLAFSFNEEHFDFNVFECDCYEAACRYITDYTETSSIGREPHEN